MSGPNYVDDKLIQRALFVLSDKIQEDLEQFYKNDPERTTSNVIKLNSGDKKLIDHNDEVKILRRQQELFSDSVVSSPELAHKIFKNNDTSVPIDVNYSITNHIILFIDNRPFYFNIDTVNYDNKKFFISNLNIKNQSKEAFTARSNYKLNLKLYFTQFDDLLEKNIKVYDLINPTYVRYIAPLQLLYKFFDYQTNQFGKSLSDGHGIYLSQTLKFKQDTDIHEQILNDLNVTELTKNYHLNYYTHKFEMFKNEEPIFKYFENELLIEYIAYEADNEDKPVSKDMEQYLPKSSGNLYEILDDEKITKSSSNFNNGEYKNKIQSLREAIDGIEAFNKLIININNTLSCKDKISIDKRNELKKSIEIYKQRIIDLKNFINFLLFNYILDELQVYSININNDVLGIYETSNFSESLWEKFSLSGVLSSIATSAPQAIAASTGTATAAAGAAAAGTVLLGAAAGAVAVYGGYAIIAAALSKKIETTNVGVDSVRNSYNNIEKKEKYCWSKLLSGEQLIALQKSILGNEEKTKSDEIINQAIGIKAPEENSQEKTNVFFTTFGEIIELINRINKFKNSINYIMGGFIFDIDVKNIESVYLNFYNIPITINNLSKFLKKQILETDKNFKYDTELFIQDIYENLIKNILKDGEIILESLKKTTPKIMKIACTVHKKNTDIKPSWIKDTDLLDDQKYKDLKSEFLRSKNLNFSTGLKTDRLFKIYIIGTIEEMKYYDFYNSYANWAASKGWANKRFMYNTLEFQEFINTEHLIPSLLMKNISDSESILKKKYVNFTRLDNVNMETGNFINGSGILRKPYQFSSDFKIYMSFFCDIGSYIFISPPISNLQADKNMFGFGGLYLIKGAELDYNFQRFVDGNVTIPNLESKYSMNGVMVTHGDSLINNLNVNKNIEKQLDCTNITDTSPAKLTEGLTDVQKRLLDKNINTTYIPQSINDKQISPIAAKALMGQI